MITRKIITQMYWKEASDGLIAHIYEHIASNYIIENMIDENLYLVADFDHWARTYGTVLYIDFRFYTNKASQVFRAALNEFNKSDVTLEMVQRAAEQVAAEYERPLMHIEPSFVNQINNIHAAPWQRIENLPAIQAASDTSVNTVFSSKGIRYGRIVSSSFAGEVLHFEISRKFYENEPAMKALAVLVVQAIALNLHQLMARNHIYYDAGDQWDMAAETVAYRTNLRFSKHGEFSREDLQEEINLYLHSLKTGKLQWSLEQLIKYHYNTEAACYFSMESMNNITGGVIIGYAGWKSVANRSVIQHLINNLTVEVLE